MLFGKRRKGRSFGGLRARVSFRKKGGEKWEWAKKKIKERTYMFLSRVKRVLVGHWREKGESRAGGISQKEKNNRLRMNRYDGEGATEGVQRRRGDALGTPSGKCGAKK